MPVGSYRLACDVVIVAIIQPSDSAARLLAGAHICSADINQKVPSCKRLRYPLFSAFINTPLRRTSLFRPLIFESEKPPLDFTCVRL